MEEPVNPYAPSQVSQEYVSESNVISVSPVALDALMRTRTWVRLVGILMVISIALSMWNRYSHVFNRVGEIGAYEMGVLMVPFIILTVYIVMAVRLMQYASAIKSLGVSNQSQDLTRAIEVQCKFWKLAGILIVVFLSLMLLAIVVSILYAY